MKNILIYILIALFPCSGYACSAFKYVSDNHVFVGKNFDWHSGSGYLLKNNRGQEKCTYLDYDGKNTCWVSKFGSVTFNQNGKEYPYGGINEAGLVVEMLWLKETVYKETGENTSTISELEWIQYHLDNFSTVNDAIANLSKLNIDPITATLHYFITDKSGKSAIIEYLNGEIVVSESVEDIQTITNSTYKLNTNAYTKKKVKFGKKYIPQKLNTISRYCSVQNNLENSISDKNFNTSSAFDILTNVFENEEGYKTYWSIVYDLSNQKIRFKTFDNKTEKSIDLASLNFASDIVTYYDLSSTGKEEQILESMDNYMPVHNYKLIQECLQPKLMFNYEQLNNHQINPITSNKDEVFASNHIDVEVTFLTKKNTGNIKYFLADSESNYNKQKPYGTLLEIKSHKTTHKLYSLPRSSKYAYGATHDVNGNGYMDRNFFKIPKEPFAFSGKKRFFFFPPKFNNATFEISEEILIEIK